MKKVLSILAMTTLISTNAFAMGAKPAPIDTSTFGGCLAQTSVDAEKAGLKNPWYPGTTAQQKLDWYAFTNPLENKCSCKFNNRPWAYMGANGEPQEGICPAV